MELGAVKNQNLLDRLAEQCAQAAERAKLCEAKASATEEALVETSVTLSTEFASSLAHEIEAVTASLASSNSKYSDRLEDQRLQAQEEMQSQLAVLSGALKLSLSQVTSSQASAMADVMAATKAATHAELTGMEERQREEMHAVVAASVSGERSSGDLENKKATDESLGVIREEVAKLTAASALIPETMVAAAKKSEDKIRRQSMAQVQLVSTQMSSKNQEFSGRMEDIDQQQMMNGGSIKGLRDELGERTDRLQALFDGLKKETTAFSTEMKTQHLTTKQSLTSNLSEIEEKLSKQATTLEDEVQNFNDESFNMQGTITGLNDDLLKLATRDKLWDVIDAKLSHHVKTLGKECSALEETASSSKPAVMSVHLQRYLAGNTQRIAKLVCTKADFEVIRRIVVSTEPELVDWDEEVNKLRAKYRVAFLEQVKEEARKVHPVTDLRVDEARDKFMGKLDLAVKVAMSKFARVQIGNTMFGRRQLVPTCMACDRPFNANGEKSTESGDQRGVSRDPLPVRNDDDDDSLGSYSSYTEGGGRGGGGGGSRPNMVVPFGVDQRKLDKFVFRAGFKIPKQISSPLEVGGQTPYGYGRNGDDNSSIGGGSVSSSVGGNRPHTVAFSGRKGGGGGSSSKRLSGGGAVSPLPTDDMASLHASSGDLPPVRHGTSPAKYR